MSYQALARKWRPRSFETIVGQEHVVRALVNAFERDRLHHAYLFSGTRGVGKTTIARVFAKGLNCERGPTARPCGECGACHEIDEGRHVDLIEVDAASRARVEETRDLLDNVQYAPVRSRFKVYLIDEVHMFSRHSFNALLKTLEEPPPHVKFLLATTDPQRLPVTILSRCLQFGLRRLGIDEIAGELARIVREEALEADPPALRVLGRAADGSMRDALSLLDQAAAYGAGRVAAADVRALIGTVGRERLLTLLEALADTDAEAMIAALDRLAGEAVDFEAVLGEVIEALGRMAALQVVPAGRDDDDEIDSLRGLAERIPAEAIQLYYQIATLGRRDLPFAPHPRTGFEMTMLRMVAFAPAGDGGSAGAKRSAAMAAGSTKVPEEPPARAQRVATAPPAPPPDAAPARAAAPADPAAPSEPKAPSETAPAGEFSSVREDVHPPSDRAATAWPAPSPEGVPTSGPSTAQEDLLFAADTGQPAPAAAPPDPGQAAAPPSAPLSEAVPVEGPPPEPVPGPAPAAPAGPEGEGRSLTASDWTEVCGRLDLNGVARQLAANCVLRRDRGETVELALGPEHGQLLNPGTQARLESALSAWLGRSIRLRVQIEDREHESPAEHDRREEQERKAKARRDLDEVPDFRDLLERFEGNARRVEPPE